MDENDSAFQLKALGDDVLRKIGRNVLLFQRVEVLLKYLVANHRADGTTTDFAQRQKERADKIKKQMMGNLVEHFTDNILSDAGETSKEPDDLTQPWVSFRFSVNISGRSDLYESHRADMEQMVAARNDLIHHFLPRWQPDSIEGLIAAVSYLDEQREKMLPLLNLCEAFANEMQKGREEMAAFLVSKEGQREFKLAWLQGSPLIASLGEIAVKAARPDGWTLLSRAGDLVRVNGVEAGINLEEHYGHSTLKQLLIASELFDVWDEPLANRRFRTVYRLKQANMQ